MPTPKILKQLATKLTPFKWHYLGLTGIGVILSLFAILASVKIEKNLFSLFGVGVITIIWGWGLFLIVNWYSDKSKLGLKFPKKLRSALSWYAALFLDLWFIVGTVGAIIFIWESLPK